MKVNNKAKPTQFILYMNYSNHYISIFILYLPRSLLIDIPTFGSVKSIRGIIEDKLPGVVIQQYPGYKL